MSDINDIVHSSQSQELSQDQKILIEENRAKAQQIREKKRQLENLSEITVGVSIKKPTSLRFIDTGGGFLLDEKDLEEQRKKNTEVVEQPPPILPPYQPVCIECQKSFSGSYLYEKFDCNVCDDCRDPKNKHALITKTEAKKNYLLNDVDLEQRGNPLKFIVGKNPHNSSWSHMKLYLLLQVEQRALEVWGSEEKLLDEIERREEKRNISKQKSYQKKMKELRMSIRSSLYTKSLSETHTHEFGAESYNEEEDTYSHLSFEPDLNYQHLQEPRRRMFDRNQNQESKSPSSNHVRKFQSTIGTDIQLKETIYDIIKTIKDPEKPATLEELNVVHEDDIYVLNMLPGNVKLIRIEFTPTLPHCSLATLIGLCIRTKIRLLLSQELKIDVFVKTGTHSTEFEINKQVNDKERVAAAMENPNLFRIVTECIKEIE